MVKWEYRKVAVESVVGAEVRRDKEGPYAQLAMDKFRLDPERNWKERGKFQWPNCYLAQDAESRLWTHDTIVLNRLGQQGWELVLCDSTTRLYLLKRPID